MELQQLDEQRVDGTGTEHGPFHSLESLTTPFSTEATPGEVEGPQSREGASWLASPFAQPFGGEASDEAIVQSLAAELHDEQFEEAIQQLIDEAAARHLTAIGSWSSEYGASEVADREAHGWMSSLAGETDRFLSHLEREFGDRAAETVTQAEIDEAAAHYLAENPVTGATQQFFGGLIRKAGNLVKGVANVVGKGVAALGKLLPVGKLFGLLRRLVRPLLERVLKFAINRLPVALRGPAQMLARKLLGEEGGDEASAAEVTAAELDARLAEAVLSGSEAGAGHVVAQAEAAEEAGEAPAVGAALDAARARLAADLAEATPGEAPTAQVQQFIPVVMAAMPLVRLGMSIVGRDKIVNFLGDRLADLIKGHIGPAAAQALGRPLADIGLRMLSLEAGEIPATSGSEAIVATLEDTVREVLNLSEEALAEPLHLEAAVQQAFSEAAARHIPHELLRPNLPTHETVNERGVWVFMPRSSLPRYRYKKYSRRIPLSLTRPVARSVILTDGATLERRLLDGGIATWPVVGEVHLFEAVPGTQLGHVAAGESGGGEAGEAADEYDHLTPEIAGLLTGEPGLGRRMAGGRPDAWRRLQPGTRFFRVVVPGIRVRRRQRIIVRLDATGPRPQLRLHLRLSEREAHELVQLLSRRAFVQIVAMFRTLMGAPMQQVLATRLGRHLSRVLDSMPSTTRLTTLAVHVTQAAVNAVAKELPAIATSLATAAADPATGVTLTFAFEFADRAAIASGAPKGPVLSVRAGMHRD